VLPGPTIAGFMGSYLRQGKGGRKGRKEGEEKGGGGGKA